jgi:3-hydroxyisobutyrate dehydrogenase-like beta-hydroxyacid dehydrogenase
MTQPAKSSIGVVGLGRMGSNMARRLAQTGHDVAVVYDIRPETSSALAAELKCRAAANLAEVTEHSSVILTVVSDDQAMKAIFQTDALLKNAAGRIFINFATVSPRVHLEVERAAHRAQARTIEACMASSITQALNGTLFLILAGDQGVVEEVEPILASLSSARKYVGGTGKAAQVKALVNMVMNINTAGLAEGLGLGQALGLDLDLLREVFAKTGANSRVLETDGADMQNREHECYFSAAHAAKDSGIAVALAEEVGLNVPLAQATLAQYRTMETAGLGDLDKSGIAELTFKGRSKP